MPKQGDDGLDLPDAAFAPPPEAERPLELDPEWVAERAAKQAAAQRGPARPSAAGVVIAVLLIAATVAAIAWIVLKH